MSQNEQDILEVVDEFADELEPDRIQSEADRLGITVDDLLGRISAEVKTRME